MGWDTAPCCRSHGAATSLKNTSAGYWARRCLPVRDGCFPRGAGASLIGIHSLWRRHFRRKPTNFLPRLSFRPFGHPVVTVGEGRRLHPDSGIVRLFRGLPDSSGGLGTAQISIVRPRPVWRRQAIGRELWVPLTPGPESAKCLPFIARLSRYCDRTDNDGFNQRCRARCQRTKA